MGMFKRFTSSEQTKLATKAPNHQNTPKDYILHPLVNFGGLEFWWQRRLLKNTALKLSYYLNYMKTIKYF